MNTKQTEALKLALEALNHMLRQAQENLVPTIHYGRVQDVMTAIREALAEQPAQQPVSWERFMSVEKELQDMTAEFMRVANELAAIKAQQQEPYGWKVYGINSLFMGEFAEADAKAEAKRIGGTCIAFPLYTSPPASKPWVGLTSEDKVEILRANGEAAVLILTEAKLREKNA